MASIELLGRPAFGLSLAMQHLLQQRLVTYLSVRDWKAWKQKDDLLDKRIVSISTTYEMADGPARLFKLALEGGAAGDEVTVGVLLR